jgi:hypothetical protein
MHWSNRDSGTPTWIQVVPWRTVEPNGVADYALGLARALRAYNGVNTIFVSGPTSVHGRVLHDEWKTIPIRGPRANFVADAIQASTAENEISAMLLHFSGYGYQRRGVPLWLLGGLRTWLHGSSDVPLVTIFHELYATGRVWNSSFWLSPVQKRIARSLLELSSAAITPTNLYGKRLSDWGGGSGAKITAMPVFSNVGEPGCGALPYARGATAIVFGLAGVEDRLFGSYRPEIERIIPTLGIEKIFDVGPRLSSMPRTLAGVPVISKGALPQRDVSELLQQARFGFVAYPIDVIGKSGVFAAYAAHGVVPIVLSDKKRQGSFDGVRPAHHFLDGLRHTAAVSVDDLASIQCELLTWYTSHGVKAQADFLVKSITSMGATEHPDHHMITAAPPNRFVPHE